MLIRLYALLGLKFNAESYDIAVYLRILKFINPWNIKNIQNDGKFEWGNLI